MEYLLAQLLWVGVISVIILRPAIKLKTKRTTDGKNEAPTTENTENSTDGSEPW